MSRGAARSQDSFLDHDSSLEDATAADFEAEAAPRRAAPAGATPTNSASRREKTASGFFSFFRWFRKGRGDDVDDDEEVVNGATGPEVVLPPTPSSVRLVRTQSSSCGSIDTLFSTATVSSFAFVTPAVYRPYGAANAPEKWIAPGPETDTYRHRVRQRERLREQDKGITLRRKYHLFGSDTQLRHGPVSPEASPVLGTRAAPPSPHPIAPAPPSSPTSSNSTFGRKKRRAPPPPDLPKIYNDYSLPSSWRKDKDTDQEGENSVKTKRHRRAASESAKDRKAGAYCHVKGKRKAPLPPGPTQPGESGSLDRFRARVASFGRKKRPAPQPPAAPSASPPERPGRADATSAAVRRPKKDQETQAEGEESAGSISKLSPEEREKLIDNIAKLKAHANRKSMGSPPVAKKDFHVGLNSSSEVVVCNDSLKLERGVLKPNKDMPKLDTSSPPSVDGKPAPVSPRPWYKRSLSSSKEKDSSGGLASGLRRDIFKSLEKRKDREKEEEWMPEAGIPRSAASAPPPSDGTSVSSNASTASASSSRFNFFSRLERNSDDKRAASGEKRRSQLSMLANISELDREAAEIVQKEQAREQALAAAHDAKFYSSPETPIYPSLAQFSPAMDACPATPPPNDNVEVPKRSSAKELISLFNAIGNVTKVTVNTAFFTREGSGFFSREGVEKRVSYSNGESVKTTTTMEEKVVMRDSSTVIQQQTKQTTVEGVNSPESRRRTGSSSSSTGVVIEEVPEELDEENDGAGARARALYEVGRARRHHSPSPSIPTIAEQSESTTPASTLDPGSKRSSMADAPSQSSVAITTAPNTTTGVIASAPDADGPVALQQAKRITIWTCPRCTLENPRWKITCDACGRWRPSVPDNKVDVEPAATPASTSAPSTPPTPSTPVTLSSLLGAPGSPTLASAATCNIPSPKVTQENEDKKTANIETPPSNTKSPIDWEEELKHYFPKGSSSQTKVKTDSSHASESAQKEIRNVFQNGISENKFVHTDNKSQIVQPTESSITENIKSEKDAIVSKAKVPLKIAMPSTFIGGRTKADEKRQAASLSATSNTTASAASIATTTTVVNESTTQKPDMDEVRKARLAFFNRGDSSEEVTSKPTETTEPKSTDGKDRRKGKGEAVYAGLKLPADEKEKKKLKEMLKEMKDSLPRYPKTLTNGTMESDISKDSGVKNENYDKCALPKVNVSSRDEGYKRGAIKKVPQNTKEAKNHVSIQNGENDKKIEAVFITSKTVIEETKIRKGGPKLPKVSTSCQTSSVVKKLEPTTSVAGSGVLPLTVEELWESGLKDGVLYTSLGKTASGNGSAAAAAGGGNSSANSSLRAFELIRARDFATIEATKTAIVGGGAGIGVHVYANVPASPDAAARAAHRAAFQPAASAPQPTPPLPPSNPRSPTPAQRTRQLDEAPAGRRSNATPSIFTSATASLGSDPATSSSPPESPPPEASSCSVASGAASDSSEVERLTAQLTLPKGLADFKADLQAQPPEHNMNTLAVNRLLRRLEAAIAGGQHHQAAVLARDLARLKISCSVTRQRRSITASPASITVDMYVEDKVSHQGPIPLQVIPGMTVAELKQKVEQEFEIPVGVQRWILGKLLASDDEKTLEDHNVNTSGCPMFLYLVAPDGDQEGDGIQNQDDQELHHETRLPSPKPPPLPPPPPAEKGGGWYYNHEDDRYSFCEDTESEMASDDDGDDKSENGAGKVPINQAKEQSISVSDPVRNRKEADIDEEEEDDEDEDDDDGAFGEKPILVQPSAVIIHDRPVVIEPATAVIDQKGVMNPTNIAGQIKNNADVGTMKLGWKCPICTLVNSPTRPGCAACTTERPVQYIVPVEYRVSPHEIERIRKEVQGDQDLMKAEAKANEQNEPNEHYQELVNLDNTDLVPNLDPFECSICFTPYGKQEGVVLRDCLHTFCKPCLVNTVQFNEEAEVKCPYRDHDYACDSVLQEREIKTLVPKHIYEQHLAKSVAQAENKIGNAFHCKTPDCRGWCIFEDNVNEFRCPVCRVINCLTCQAIHDGINCKQYQEQVQQQSETNAEARRTKEMLEEMVVRGEAMACPTCQVVLMKKWGCDWLRCSMCKTEICWVTRGPRWGPGGKGDTTGGCQCGVNGVKCHPRCNYCH